MMSDDRATILGAGGQQMAVGYGDGQWDDLAGQTIESGRLERVVYLPFGTVMGNPTVEVLVRTEGGLLVHANTTWALWRSTTEVLTQWDLHR